MTQPLAGRRIALPEHRELDRLARMLEGEGAAVLRCPLVAICDAPDPAPVAAWLDRLCAAPPDDVVFYTGEGVRRLAAFAGRRGQAEAFVAALRASRKIVRGPKPVAALRELGLNEDLRAAAPTTDGLITTLSAATLRGRRIAVQLYPDAGEPRLVDFLRSAGADADPVVPYAYASDADDGAVGALIAALAAGRVDAIAFTSAAQIRRLFDAAEGAGRAAELASGLARTAVAAIGPVTAGELSRRGVAVAIAPRERYFMKPLVASIAAALGTP